MVVADLPILRELRFGHSLTSHVSCEPSRDLAIFSLVMQGCRAEVLPLKLDLSVHYGGVASPCQRASSHPRSVQSQVRAFVYAVTAVLVLNYWYLTTGYSVFTHLWAEP